MTDPQVALITGASAGIGRAIAEKLAGAGYVVFGTSRHPDRSTGTAGVQMLALDVRSDASAKAAIASVLASAGRLDVLVNSAGYTLTGAVEEVSLAEAEAQFETNFFGVMRMVQAALPAMRERGGGRIINLSGPAGMIPVPFMGLFSASKAALEAYTQALRHETRPFGIRVALVVPGPIRSQIVANSQQSANPLEAYAAWRAPFLTGWQQAYGKAEAAAVVAEAAWQAIKARSPRVHYTAGRGVGAMLVMRRLLPEALFERVLRQSLGLDKKGTGHAHARKGETAPTLSVR